MEWFQSDPLGLHTLRNIIAKKKINREEKAGGIKNIRVLCICGDSYRLFVTFHFWFCLVPFQTLAERCPTYLYRNEGINCIILNFKKTSIWRLLEGGWGGS